MTRQALFYELPLLRYLHKAPIESRAETTGATHDTFLASSPPRAEQVGTKVKPASLHFPFDNPHDAVQETGTYGGQGKAVRRQRPPTALLFVEAHFTKKIGPPIAAAATMIVSRANRPTKKARHDGGYRSAAPGPLLQTVPSLFARIGHYFVHVILGGLPCLIAKICGASADTSRTERLLVIWVPNGTRLLTFLNKCVG